MKTNIFDFKRLGLLFKRYFTERSHTELIYWSIMAIVFMFIRNVTPLMIILIIVAGAFYAGRFFREIHSRSNGVAYFMIPATQLEKLVVGIVMTSFYYFAMMMITYVIGNVVGTFLNNILANVNTFGLNIFGHSSLQWKLFSDNSGMVVMMHQQETYKFLGTGWTFLALQSIYLFGSIYFKSNQTLKTFLAANIIQILLVIVLFIEVWFIFGNGGLNFMNLQNPYEYGKMAGRILRSVFYLLPPFFWVASYFRLTEKQI